MEGEGGGGAAVSWWNLNPHASKERLRPERDASGEERRFSRQPSVPSTDTAWTLTLGRGSPDTLLLFVPFEGLHRTTAPWGGAFSVPGKFRVQRYAQEPECGSY